MPGLSEPTVENGVCRRDPRRFALPSLHDLGQHGEGVFGIGLSCSLNVRRGLVWCSGFPAAGFYAVGHLLASTIDGRDLNA